MFSVTSKKVPELIPYHCYQSNLLFFLVFLNWYVYIQILFSPLLTSILSSSQSRPIRNCQFTFNEIGSEENISEATDTYYIQHNNIRK